MLFLSSPGWERRGQCSTKRCLSCVLLENTIALRRCNRTSNNMITSHHSPYILWPTSVSWIAYDPVGSTSIIFYCLCQDKGQWNSVSIRQATRDRRHQQAIIIDANCLVENQVRELDLNAHNSKWVRCSLSWNWLLIFSIRFIFASHCGGSGGGGGDANQLTQFVVELEKLKSEIRKLHTENETLRHKNRGKWNQLDTSRFNSFYYVCFFCSCWCCCQISSSKRSCTRRRNTKARKLAESTVSITTNTTLRITRATAREASTSAMPIIVPVPVHAQASPAHCIRAHVDID